MLRGQHLFLMPGDSPVGLRLAAAELAVGGGRRTRRSHFRWIRWSTAVRCRCRRAVVRSTLRACNRASDRSAIASPTVGESAPWIVRTALCVEPRDGRLYVFMPPVTAAEDYLDLLAAIEDTAAHLEMPVVIEGYTPPHDPRIQHIKVTPDPGVIEVNVHPAQQLAGTGGEHHGALRRRAAVRAWARKNSCSTAGTPAPAAAIISCSAAPTPADSPFLRRPDLLRSMIGYWLNHPSLSYLFSTHLHRAHQPGAARRRNARRTASTNWRSPSG